jgi:hypothetical protein
MAFNPFHAFRRHQKVMFALLTIMAMITFVFCGGYGGKEPLLEKITGWLGLTNQRTGRTVADLYGSSVTEVEIAEARESRMVARQSLATAFMIALGKIGQEEADLMKKPDSPDRVTRLGDLQTKRQKVEAAQMAFFLTPGGDRVEDVLDHLIWRHEADRLGIHFTERDVDAQMRTLSQGHAGVQEVVDQMASGNRYDRARFRREPVEKAVADLFRTELARAVVLESNPASRMSATERSMLLRQLQFGQIPPQFLSFFVPETGPLAVTPYEFRNFMAEQRTEVDIGLFRVPVKPDPKMALGEKDEKTLRALYDRWKDVEPTPESARPGFKEPRRLTVEWIGVLPGDDYWTEQAGKVLPLIPPANLVLAGSSFNTFTIASQLLKADSRTHQAYEAVKDGYQFGRSAWHVGQWDLPIYTAKTHPEMAAGLVGEIGGALATGGTPLSAVLEFQNRALRKNVADLHTVIDQEAPNRVPFAATTVLAGTNPTPFAAAALWYHEDKRPQHLPIDKIRPVVEKKMKTEVAKSVVLAKLREFRKELEEKAKAGPKEAQAYLEKVLKEPWVSLHANMKDAKDQYNLGNDLALLELRKAFEKENPFDPKIAEKFGETFFRAAGGVYQPQALPDDQPFFQGSTESRWSSAEQPFVWWKTEDKAAFVPSFEQARPKVEEAWRLAQARPGSRKEAEALLAKVKEAEGDRQRLLQIAAERKDDPMTELNNVARMVKMPVAMGPSRPEPYKFPDAHKANHKDWLDKIAGLKKKGDAVLLKDQPEQAYYVAVLLTDPKPPSAEEVATAYRGTPGGGMGGMGGGPDPLFREFLRERQAKYRDAIMKELRLAAVGTKGLEDDGRYKLDADFRKDGRDDGPPVEGG